MQSETDIVVIGAGAAGLAAGRMLATAPVEFLIVEAQGRIGGRAFTAEVDGFPLDLGCGWLHSAETNRFAGLAEDLGFPVDRLPPNWSKQSGDVGFSLEERAEYHRALVALDARVAEAAAGGRDVAVASLMDPDGRWNPLLHAFSSFYNGAEFDSISTVDYDAYHDGELNWRIPLGYGAMVRAYAAPLTVILDNPVRRIDRTGRRLLVETARGTVSARAVIVTVPTPLLAEGRLQFIPDLPDLREAAASLPMGLADKLYLRVEQPEEFPVEGHLFGNPSRTATGSYHLRPFGRPLIEVFLGGAHARALEAEGAGATSAFAVNELVNLLGSDIRRRLTPIVATRWANDPWALGSYSHALPGAASARRVLARPVEQRIFFAGEATSAHEFSTAHGAADSGIAAAKAALEAVGAAP
jgi:monoamine oxidase